MGSWTGLWCMPGIRGLGLLVLLCFKRGIVSVGVCTDYSVRKGRGKP